MEYKCGQPKFLLHKKTRIRNIKTRIRNTFFSKNCHFVIKNLPFFVVFARVSSPAQHKSEISEVGGRDWSSFLLTKLKFRFLHFLLNLGQFLDNICPIYLFRILKVSSLSIYNGFNGFFFQIGDVMK